MTGIPASQQHLVWHSDELADDQSLQDCRVHSGATLRLVLNMRGGPINTRRGTYTAQLQTGVNLSHTLFVM